MSDREINYRRFYLSYGLELDSSDQEMQGDCPFCNGKLFINARTGLADCKKSCPSWNSWSFLSRLVENCPQTLETLAINRGISEATLQEAGVCQNFLNDEYLLPSYAYGTDGRIKLLNVYRVREQSNGKLIVQSGPSPCRQQPYLIDRYKGQKTVFICEGHWDALYWLDCLAHTRRRGIRRTRLIEPSFQGTLAEEYAVVGAPGATTWKDEWFKPLHPAHTVCLLFDNDDAGQNGMQRMVKKLTADKQWTPEIRILDWSNHEVNDIRDLQTL